MLSVIAISAANQPIRTPTVKIMDATFSSFSAKSAPQNLMVAVQLNARTSSIYPKKNKKNSGKARHKAAWSSRRGVLSTWRVVSKQFAVINLYFQNV
jgi:hypothetical protein